MDSSLFPDIHLAGGISTQAEKYRQMAREGDEWRSRVFDIGNAKAQSAIPAPKKITRKSPHQNSRASINEPKQPGSSRLNEQGSSGFASFTAGKDNDFSADGTRANIYQPRMSTTADSMRTAVDNDDFNTDSLGKNNVATSLLDRDITISP
jgi:Protein of unknown function (DUF4449)